MLELLKMRKGIDRICDDMVMGPWYRLYAYSYDLNLAITIPPAGYLHLWLRFSKLGICQLTLLKALSQSDSEIFSSAYVQTAIPSGLQLGLEPLSSVHINFTYNRTTIKSRSQKTKLIPRSLQSLEGILSPFTHKILWLTQ